MAQERKKGDEAFAFLFGGLGFVAFRAALQASRVERQRQVDAQRAAQVEQQQVVVEQAAQVEQQRQVEAQCEVEAQRAAQEEAQRTAQVEQQRQVEAERAAQVVAQRVAQEERQPVAVEQTGAHVVRYAMMACCYLKCCNHSYNSDSTRVLIYCEFAGNQAHMGSGAVSMNESVQTNMDAAASAAASMNAAVQPAGNTAAAVSAAANTNQAVQPAVSTSVIKEGGRGPSQGLADKLKAWSWTDHVNILEAKSRGNKGSFTCKFCKNASSIPGGRANFVKHLLGESWSECSYQCTACPEYIRAMLAGV